MTNPSLVALNLVRFFRLRRQPSLNAQKQRCFGLLIRKRSLRLLHRIQTGNDFEAFSL